MPAVVQLPSLREQQRRRFQSGSWHAGSLGSETFVRSFNLLRYCLICSVSLFKAMVRRRSMRECNILGDSAALLHPQTNVVRVAPAPEVCNGDPGASFRSVSANKHELLVRQAPWALAVIEALIMLLLYFIMVPDAVVVRKPLLALNYSFKDSLEDVLMFSLARDLAVVLAYAFGAGAHYHRWAFSIAGSTCAGND